MQQTVLFFGRPSERLGASIQIERSDQLSLSALKTMLLDTYPDAEAVLVRKDVRAAINGIVCSNDADIPAGAEVAFFSIFSGG